MIERRVTSGFTAALALVERVPMSLHQLLFRLAIAGVFLRAGLLKLDGWESTVALFRDEYKVPVLPPDVAAALATSVEIVCPTLLLLGLATRFAALPLLGMIATIQLFVYPQAWPEHLVWSAILVLLVTRGGGTMAVDHAIAPRRHDPDPAGSYAPGAIAR
jgi:putative oxidoreductase